MSVVDRGYQLQRGAGFRIVAVRVSDGVDGGRFKVQDLRRDEVCTDMQ